MTSPEKLFRKPAWGRVLAALAATLAAFPGCKLSNQGTAKNRASQAVATQPGSRSSPPVSIAPRKAWVQVGQSLTLTAAGGVAPYDFLIIDGPGGIDAGTGRFSPPAGSATTHVRVTDSTGNSWDETDVFTYEALSLRRKTVNLSYNAGAQKGNYHSILASGGSGTYTCSALGQLSGTLQGCTYTAPEVTQTNQALTLTDKIEITSPIPGNDPLREGVTVNVVPRISCAAHCSWVSAGEKCELKATQGVPFDPASGNGPYLYQVESGLGSVHPATGLFSAPNWIDTVQATTVVRIYDALYNSCTLTINIRNGLSLSPATFVTLRSPPTGDPRSQVFQFGGGRPKDCVFPPANNPPSASDCPADQGPYDLRVTDSWMQAKGLPALRPQDYNAFYSARYGADSKRSGGRFSIVQLANPDAPGNAQYNLTYTVPQRLPIQPSKDPDSPNIFNSRPGEDDTSADMPELTLTLTSADRVGTLRTATIRISDGMVITPNQIASRIALGASAATEFEVQNGIPPYTVAMCAGSEAFGRVDPVAGSPGHYRWTPPTLDQFRPPKLDATGKQSFRLPRAWHSSQRSGLICIDDLGTLPGPGNRLKEPERVSVSVDRGPLILGSNGNDELAAVLSDSDNNLYLIGMTDANDGSFDGLSAHYPAGSPGAVTRDLFVLKVDKAGRPTWRAVFGNEFEQLAKSAALSEISGKRFLVITGTTKGRALTPDEISRNLCPAGLTGRVDGLRLSPEPATPENTASFKGMAPFSADPALGACTGPDLSSGFLVRLDIDQAEAAFLAANPDPEHPGRFDIPYAAFSGMLLQAGDFTPMTNLASSVGSLVGTPQLQSHDLAGVAVDPDGNIYVAGRTSYRFSVLFAGSTTSQSRIYSDAIVGSYAFQPAGANGVYFSPRWRSCNGQDLPTNVTCENSGLMSQGRVLGTTLANDSASSVAVRDQSVYVVGTTASLLFTNDEQAGVYSEARGYSDIFTAAFRTAPVSQPDNDLPNTVWRTKLGNAGPDYGNLAAVSGDGTEVYGVGQVSPASVGTADVFKNLGSQALAAVGFTLGPQKTERSWQSQLKETRLILSDGTQGFTDLRQAIPRALAWREIRPYHEDIFTGETREPNLYTTVDAQPSSGTRQRAVIYCSGATGARCSGAGQSGTEVSISSGSASGSFGTSLRGLTVLQAVTRDSFDPNGELKPNQHHLIIGGHMDGTLFDGSATTGVRAGRATGDTDLFLIEYDMNLEPQ